MPRPSSPQFRRPASLSPARADEIPGAPDPQEATALAHSSARALLDGVYRASDERVVQRVLRLVETEGLEDLAQLWSSAPALTLPGALWRLYLLHTWVQRSGDEVVRRYREGAGTVPGLRYLAGIADPPDVEQAKAAMDTILRGAFNGDLPIALGRAGALAVLCAYGTAHLADRREAAAEQAALTRQASRLLSTGEDLLAAARLAEDHALD